MPEKKGLKEGDEIISINGVGPNRNTLWKMRYFYYTLAPRSSMKVVAQGPSSEPREIDIMANVKQLKTTVDLNYDNYITALREAESERPLRAHRYYENMDDVFIWKMPRFDLSESKVDEMMNRASNRKALILDLRGNGGGFETTLLRLISHFSDKEVSVGEIQRRKEKKPLIAKKRGDKAFTGQLVVLVDSESGSSAEMFARVVQLEKRGTVVGDQTAGAVMRSRYYDHTIGVDIFVAYGGDYHRCERRYVLLRRPRCSRICARDVGRRSQPNFTANMPPKPQHCSASVISPRPSVRHPARNSARLGLHTKLAQPRARIVIGHRGIERRAPCQTSRRS